MAQTCVEIESLPDGTFSVVLCEPRETPNEAESGGQSFTSIDEALSAAKTMLAPAPAAGPSDFEVGFDAVRGGV